jgi:hypothetical protein
MNMAIRLKQPQILSVREEVVVVSLVYFTASRVFGDRIIAFLRKSCLSCIRLSLNEWFQVFPRPAYHPLGVLRCSFQFRQCSR